MVKKKRASKRRTTKRKTARQSKTRKRAKKTTINVRRSSGRKEKFDIDRMSRTTGRLGVPFPMARDVAKSISRKIRAEARGQGEKTITAGRVRKMIAKELRDRNEQTVASSYAGDTPENTQKQNMALKVRPHESVIGSADRDQHEAYRADRDSVMHDRSKRLASAS